LKKRDSASELPYGDHWNGAGISIVRHITEKVEIRTIPWDLVQALTV